MPWWRKDTQWVPFVYVTSKHELIPVTLIHEPNPKLFGLLNFWITQRASHGNIYRPTHGGSHTYRCKSGIAYARNNYTTLVLEPRENNITFPKLEERWVRIVKFHCPSATKEQRWAISEEFEHGRQNVPYFTEKEQRWAIVRNPIVWNPNSVKPQSVPVDSDSWPISAVQHLKPISVSAERNQRCVLQIGH